MAPFIEFGNLIPDVVTQAAVNPDQRHRETRARLYRQMPNENMKMYPLTKIVMSNAGESVGAPKYEWGMFSHNDRYHGALGCWENAACSDEIEANENKAEDDTIWLEVTQASARQFTKYEEVEIRLVMVDPTHPAHLATVQGQVVSISATSSPYYIEVKLFEADQGHELSAPGAQDNVLGQGHAAINAGPPATGAVYISPISPAMPEGSGLPWQRYREPEEKFNYTQIVMAGLSLTGSELSNLTRFNETTYDAYLKQMHEQFNSYIERMILFGTRREDQVTINYGNEDQTVDQYRTGGLRYMLRYMGQGQDAEHTNIINIPRLAAYSDYNFTGKTWLEGGYDFIKLFLVEKSRKSGMRKQLYCGCDAYLDIMNMFESQTNVQISPSFKNKWGFEVTKIDGLNCELEMMQHADLSCNAGWTRSAFVIEPEKLGIRTKRGRDMTLIRSKKDLKKMMEVENGWTWRDGIKEGIVMDAGLIADDIDGMAIINGIGEDFAAA